MFQELSDGHNWSILASECDSYAADGTNPLCSPSRRWRAAPVNRPSRDYGRSPFASCQQAAKAPLRHDGFNIRSCP